MTLKLLLKYKKIIKLSGVVVQECEDLEGRRGFAHLFFLRLVHATLRCERPPLSCTPEGENSSRVTSLYSDGGSSLHFPSAGGQWIQAKETKGLMAELRVRGGEGGEGG